MEAEMTTLEEARSNYFKYKTIGKTVYFVHHASKGYNQNSYSAMRIFGSPAEKEDFINGFGGNVYCGGVSFNGKDQSDCEFGETFSFIVWGCD